MPSGWGGIKMSKRFGQIWTLLPLRASVFHKHIGDRNELFHNWQRCRKVSDMSAKPIKFARVRPKLRKYRSKCPTSASNVVLVKCANRLNHGCLNVFFLSTLYLLQSVLLTRNIGIEWDQTPRWHPNTETAEYLNTEMAPNAAYIFIIVTYLSIPMLYKAL